MSTKTMLKTPDNSELKKYTCIFSIATSVDARNEDEAKYLAIRELYENTDMYEFVEDQIIEEETR